MLPHLHKHGLLRLVRGSRWGWDACCERPLCSPKINISLEQFSVIRWTNTSRQSSQTLAFCVTFEFFLSIIFHLCKTTQVLGFSLLFPAMNEPASSAVLRPTNGLGYVFCSNLCCCSICLHWEAPDTTCAEFPPLSWADSIVCRDLVRGWLYSFRIWGYFRLRNVD